jgi:hypothetical protein
MENSKKREFAYSHWSLVEIDGKKVTVNKANEMYLAYFAEGNTEKAEAIKTAIVEAKTKVRTDYPDESV